MTDNPKSALRNPPSTITLAVVLARAGSKGLADKNVLELAGQPMVAWTLACARAARSVDQLVLSTDGPAIAAVARKLGVAVIERPAELATDTAAVDAAARHAVEAFERSHSPAVVADPVVILYANVPLRPADLIDRALAKLRDSGADSVQSVVSVGKMHPYWMRRLIGPQGDVLEPYVENSVYRRQDLPAVYMLDGGIIAVRRAALFTVVQGQPHAFLGRDRRAVLTQPGEVVDIDTPMDLEVARALMRQRSSVDER